MPSCCIRLKVFVKQWDVRCEMLVKSLANILDLALHNESEIKLIRTAQLSSYHESVSIISISPGNYFSNYRTCKRQEWFSVQLCKLWDQFSSLIGWVQSNLSDISWSCWGRDIVTGMWNISNLVAARMTREEKKYQVYVSQCGKRIWQERGESSDRDVSTQCLASPPPLGVVPSVLTTPPAWRTSDKPSFSSAAATPSTATVTSPGAGTARQTLPRLVERRICWRQGGAVASPRVSWWSVWSVSSWCLSVLWPSSFTTSRPGQDASTWQVFFLKECMNLF